MIYQVCSGQMIVLITLYSKLEQSDIAVAGIRKIIKAYEASSARDDAP